jgi:large subunit ribosomal protein L21
MCSSTGLSIQCGEISPKGGGEGRRETSSTADNHVSHDGGEFGDDYYGYYNRKWLEMQVVQRWKTPRLLPENFDRLVKIVYNNLVVGFWWSPCIVSWGGIVDLMQAVFEMGGKQYKVSVGQTVDVEKLPYAVGESVELDRVLTVFDEDEVKIGSPLLEGARVLATVTEQGRGRKMIVFKYKPRNRYRRKLGHRQAYTRLLIEDIVV